MKSKDKKPKRIFSIRANSPADFKTKIEALKKIDKFWL